MIARTADFPGNGPPVMGPGEVEQVRYAPTGHLVYGQGLRVMAVPFDLRSLTLRGSPVPVVDSVIRGQGGGAVSFAISQTGVLAYAPEGLHQLAWVGRDGRATVISPDRDKFRFPALSPDGKRVAVVIVSEARQSHIWIYDAESGRKTKLTEEAISPRWTPDGTRVAFCGGTTTSLTWRMADGSGTQDFMFSGRQRCPTSWSSDGGTLLVNRFDDPTTKVDVWALRREAHDTSTRALLTQSFNEADAKFSPDDRWVAYVSDESGRYEVYVMSYPALKGRTAISTDGGARPVWSRDGHELFYRQGTAIMAVSVRTGQEFHADKPRLLFDGPYVGQGGDISFDVAPDGRFLMVTGDEASLGRQLNVVTNWFTELQQRVPTR